MTWSRADTIAAIALGVGILGLVAAWLVVPEFRRLIGLDKAEVQKPVNNAGKASWYESNLFWGPMALGISILLTVIGAIKHDLRWLLWFAAPCFTIGFWALIKRWLRRGWLVLSVVFAGLLICLGLYRVHGWLGTPNAEQVGDETESGSQATTIQSTPAQAEPGTTTTQPAVVQGNVTKRKAESIGKPVAPAQQPALQEALPKQESKAATPQQDNSVHIGAGATVDQQSSGPCSPNIIGGSNTINCGPQPKNLTDDQIVQMSSALKGTQLDVIVWAKGGDKIGWNLAEDMCKSFRAAGWRIDGGDVQPIVPGPPVDVDIGVFVNPADAEMVTNGFRYHISGVAQLVAALRSFGFSVGLGTSDKVPKTFVKVVME